MDTESLSKTKAWIDNYVKNYIPLMERKLRVVYSSRTKKKLFYVEPLHRAVKKNLIYASIGLLHY